jgi:hypothetical protein
MSKAFGGSKLVTMRDRESKEGKGNECWQLRKKVVEYQKNDFLLVTLDNFLSCCLLTDQCLETIVQTWDERRWDEFL